MSQPLPSAALVAPELDFSVEGAEAARHSASPAIAFRLGVARRGGGPIRSAMLTVQIRIAVTRRPYTEKEQELLRELFGPPSDWGRSLHSLLWAQLTTVVPPFDDATTVELHVPCTYDLEVSAAKYFAALGDGEVPLEFLFGGTAFYTGEDGALATSLISWEAETSYRLPVAVWREAIDRHFPGSAWLRLDRELFDRLAAYRARHSLATWETTLERLLEGER